MHHRFGPELLIFLFQKPHADGFHTDLQPIKKAYILGFKSVVFYLCFVFEKKKRGKKRFSKDWPSRTLHVEETQTTPRHPGLFHSETLHQGLPLLCGTPSPPGNFVAKGRSAEGPSLLVPRLFAGDLFQQKSKQAVTSSL